MLSSFAVILPRIRDRYRRMYALTKDACGNPELYAINELLEKREELFKAIDKDAALVKEQKPTQAADQELQREIETTLRSMQECDLILMHILENSRDAIANRLRSLNASSRASFKYIRQSSMRYQPKRSFSAVP